MNYFLPLLFMLALLTSCNNQQSQSKSEAQTEDTVATVVKENTQTAVKDADSSQIELTKTILKLLKSKNYKGLAQYIHPVKGIRLSPYGYVNVNEDMIIRAEQIDNMSKDPQTKVWGTYDGTGDTIQLSFKEYFDKFVYDVDFLNAEYLSVNRSLAQGNSLNNISEIYPGATFTESYFSGFDKRYDGMDWRALRLVFEKHASKHYLVAVIHDQWTI